MPNHLADESSPYLLQHKNNPVDWYPWGEEALAKSKEENKPIFLSIGYSACHWCHVMEHESFEDEEIAKYVNEHFIAVKVDREERPDIDQIYMNAVQMMTGRGGWPMTVFLTPDLKPFFAGTYFPPKRRGQHAGFDEVLRAVNDAWTNRQEQVVEGADKITEQLQSQDTASGELSRDLIHEAAKSLQHSHDPTWGGFGQAPKFPHTMDLQLLLRHWFRTGDNASLAAVQTTLDRMAAGGIYDHLGGGFARYSVDARWLVPHFEKMLYDNALLTLIYLDAFLVTGDVNYKLVIQETLDYILRDMTDEAGAFYSTEDADSEGEEGKFYIWTLSQLEEVLGAEAAETFARVYDVTEQGNFEDPHHPKPADAEKTSILNLPKTITQAANVLGRDETELRKELDTSRAKLFAAREKRVHPGKDDKVIVAWNGLMIDAMARAGVALDEPRYVDAARKCADFLLENLRREDGRLLHTWRHGKAKLDAYLDDYSALANSLVTLYETTFEGKYLESAVELTGMMEEHFSDPDAGGYFYTADDHEQLITRNKDFMDNATPCGNSLAATLLVRLAKLTGDSKFSDAAESTLRAAAGIMEKYPSAAGQMLIALDLHMGPTFELVLSGLPEDQRTSESLGEIRERFLPHVVLAGAVGAEAPRPLESLLAGKEPEEGQDPTLYVCEDFMCRAPVKGLQGIRDALEKLGRTDTILQ
ncbi:MAG: thioredoxin domain-containing protein [Lacipirellulaceae bacterium]